MVIVPPVDIHVYCILLIMNHNWLPFSLDILEVQRVDIGIQFNYVSLQIGKFDSINLHVHVHVLHVCIYTLLPDIHVHVHVLCIQYIHCYVTYMYM